MTRAGAGAWLVDLVLTPFLEKRVMEERHAFIP